jgi:MFS family permease
LDRGEWLTLAVLGFAQFCSQVTFSCIVPFFPSEAAQKGLNTTQIGLLIGVFMLISFLASPILGKFMAQLGPMRLFTSGLLICGFSAILFG